MNSALFPFLSQVMQEMIEDSEVRPSSSSNGCNSPPSSSPSPGPQVTAANFEAKVRASNQEMMERIAKVNEAGEKARESKNKKKAKGKKQ